MKRFVAVSMVFVLTVVFAGIVMATGTGEGETVTWKLVVPANPGQPLYEESISRIVEPIEASSDGRITIDVFSETEMGSGPEIVQNLRSGAVEMHWQAFAITASYVPEFNFTSLPFIFTNREHFDRFIRTDVGKTLLRSAEPYGVYVFETGLIGYRYPVSNSVLFRTPAEFQGFRMRTMENQLQIQTMEALGANPVVLPYGEVYQSIQNSLVGGYFNDRNSFEYLSIYEVAPYLTELPLFSLGLSLAISKEAFDELPHDLQTIVRTAVEAAVPDILATQWSYNVEETAWKDLFAETIAVRDIAPFVDKVAPLYDAYIKDNPEGLPFIEGVQAAR